MNINDEIDWFVLAAYFNGTCSDDERAVVETWLAGHPDRTAALHQLRTIWGARQDSGRLAYDRNALRARIHDAVHATASTGAGQGDTAAANIRANASRGLRLGGRTYERWTRRVWRSSVVRLGAATIAAALLFAVVTTQRTRRATTSGTAQVYTTTVGQRADVSLSDGTRVALAPSSTLRVIAGFGRETRTVILEGQGYFDIAHSAGAPFIVRTGEVTTRVLGTEFDIKHYRADQTVRVAVLRGKVRVMGATDKASLTLTAGAVGYATDSTVTAGLVNDTALYAGWRDGHLVFHDAPIHDVLQTLGRWYGIDVKLGDPGLENTRLTADFDFKSSRNVVTALEVLLHATATYDRASDSMPVVTLRLRRTGHTPPARTTKVLSTQTEVGR